MTAPAPGASLAALAQDAAADPASRETLAAALLLVGLSVSQLAPSWSARALQQFRQLCAVRAGVDDHALAVDIAALAQRLITGGAR